VIRTSALICWPWTRRTGKTIGNGAAEFRRGFASRSFGVTAERKNSSCPAAWLKSYNLKDGKELWTVAGTSRVREPPRRRRFVVSASWNYGADQATDLPCRRSTICCEIRQKQDGNSPR